MSSASRYFAIFIIIIIGTYQASQEYPLPPPASDIAFAIVAPVDHTWKVITQNTSTTVQAAPSTPLYIYYKYNDTLDVIIDSKAYNITPNGTWALVVESLDAGVHIVRVLNITISIYVLSITEEATLQAKQVVSGDPWRLKRVYAVTATLVAILFGIPLGSWLRHIYEDKKGTKIEEV